MAYFRGSVGVKDRKNRLDDGRLGKDVESGQRHEEIKRTSFAVIDPPLL